MKKSSRSIVKPCYQHPLVVSTREKGGRTRAQLAPCASSAGGAQRARIVRGVGRRQQGGGCTAGEGGSNLPPKRQPSARKEDATRQPTKATCKGVRQLD